MEREALIKNLILEINQYLVVMPNANHFNASHVLETRKILEYLIRVMPEIDIDNALSLEFSTLLLRLNKWNDSSLAPDDFEFAVFLDIVKEDLKLIKKNYSGVI